MRNSVIKYTISILCSFLIVSSFFGNDVLAASDAGRTAANFLQIGVGADAAGMGGAYTSVSRGASAAFWNPARIVSSGATEISLSHFMWYQGIKLEHGAAAIMLSPKLALGASVTFLDYGTIDAYDVNGNSIGQVSSYDMQGGLSLSIALNERLSVGVTGKYVGEKLADVSASTFAGDFGFSYQAERWSLSLAAVNLGPGITFDTEKEKLPSAMRAGVAVTPFTPSLLTSVEVEKRMYGDMVVRNGIEVSVREQYYLRGGLNYFPQNTERKFSSGFSLGAGVRFGKATLDYAFTPSDSYTSDDLHRFTLVMTLGH
ncbi:hypothetical protein C3F09_00020 [candidate division GN15 bacterium]|uniref:PorV/PorQ family protein n=1 Tax=candidate division GN15 bacterium TaxID=2072418 RepID=A0A855XC68_9BACT|nr:MAG: hypothetical protein C3F09_00020 [candidate division GN15 bacterium]